MLLFLKLKDNTFTTLLKINCLRAQGTQMGAQCPFIYRETTQISADESKLSCLWKELVYFRNKSQKQQTNKSSASL